MDYYNLPRYTFLEWEKWEGDWELIEGYPWAMSPSPSSKHQRVCGRLFIQMDQALDGCGRCSAYLPINYRINDDTVLHPDISVVCDVAEEFLYLDQTPSIVVEVLSPSTAMKDLHIKAQLYAEQGIPYYLILHPDEEWVRVMVLAGARYEAAYEGKDGGFDFDLGECKFQLQFAGIW
ncbi:MAG: Uma2 family endonuclease [Bacteroidia bacterium]